MPLRSAPGGAFGVHFRLLPVVLLWACVSSVQAPDTAHPAAGQGGAPVPESAAGMLPPDYAARVQRAQDRATHAKTAVARDHAERLARVWMQAGQLEAQRIIVEHERSALARERSELLQRLLSSRAGHAEMLQSQHLRDLATLEQQRVASAFSVFYGAQQERKRGPLPAGLRTALGTLHGALSLWVDGASGRPLDADGNAALQAARASADAFGAALLRADITTPRALSRAETALERVEKVLGRLSLPGPVLLEQAAIRGLEGASEDGAVVVRLPGPTMFEREGALSPLGRRSVRALRGLLREFGHLAPSLQVPVAARGSRASQVLRAALSGLAVSAQPAPGSAFQVRFVP